MKPQINAYLEGLLESEVRSLAEVIDFNEKHADQELPPRRVSPFRFFRLALINLTLSIDHPRQDNFIAAQNKNITTEEYGRNLSYLREMGREKGIDLALKRYGVDVILGPIDSTISSLATASGG